jgi:O-antigen ligase
MGTGSAVAQALAALRFFIFAAALENWVLADVRTRRRLWYVILATAVWILVEVWQQYLFGVNSFGYPRWLDGALTGPFRGPVAGPMFLAVFFPAFLPLCFLLLRQPGRTARLCGIAIPILASATMILIGQRMPAVLMALGLCASGLLFRQVRLPVALSLAVGAAVLALLPMISPPTFAKLVVHFSDQMRHFWESQYGLIFGRAVTMIQAHPLLGLGWDGYRDHCMQPEYLRGVSWVPVSDPASELGCSIHPHNYWLQVGTNAGVPGILLLMAFGAVLLLRVRGNAAALANDRRAGVLVILFVMLWPIASATSFFTVPNAGWIFLMIGWGLAEALDQPEATRVSSAA